MRLLFTIALLGSIATAQAQVALGWAKNMEGQGFGQGDGVAVDTSGNVYTTGELNGTADFDPGPGVFSLTSAGDNDVYVSKLDADGNFVWAISLGGVLFDQGHAIALDGQGNVYVTGIFYGNVDFDPGQGANVLNNTGGYDIFVLKLDADGQFVWAKSMGNPQLWNNYPLAMAVDWDGNVCVTGRFIGITDFDPGADVFNVTSHGQDDIFVVKLDANGEFLWAVGIGQGYIDQGSSIVQDIAGNYYVTGYFQGFVDFDPGPGVTNLSSTGNTDAFVLKLDHAGQFLWAKQMGGNSHDEGTSISLDGQGNIYSTGVFVGTADFDPGPLGFALTSAGFGDLYVSKLTTNGDFVWAKQVGGPDSNYPHSVKVDYFGNVYAAGYFASTMDCDPGVGIYPLTPVGNYDYFLFKLDYDGNLVWAYNTGASGFDQGRALALDGYGSIYVTGTFLETVDFDPGQGLANLTSGGIEDAFVLKINDLTTGIEAPNVDASLQLYPNPTNGQLVLELDKTSNIFVYNSIGALVFQFEATQGVSQHDLSFLPNGVYYLKVLNGGGAGTQKLMIAK